MYLQPEERLVLAIIRQAIQDLYSTDKEISEEANNWLFYDEEDFVFLVSLTRMNAKELRKKLIEYTVL